MVDRMDLMRTFPVPERFMELPPRRSSIRPAIDRILVSWDVLARFFQEEYTSERRNMAAETLHNHISISTNSGAKTRAMFKFMLRTLVHFERADAAPVLLDLSATLQEKQKTNNVNASYYSHINSTAPYDMNVHLLACANAGIEAAIKYLSKWGPTTSSSAHVLNYSKGK